MSIYKDYLDIAEWSWSQNLKLRLKSKVEVSFMYLKLCRTVMWTDWIFNK